MKTIGMIGGLSWESSAVYYSLMNKLVKEKLGGYHNCKSVMLTVDFAEIELLQRAGDWAKMDELMADAASKLEAAGADVVILCTNTMHLCSEAIRGSISVPFLHIAEATGRAIVKQGAKKVALLGTSFTMEKDFYKTLLKEEFGIETIIPEKGDRDKVHRVIYEELVNGEIKDESRKMYQEVIGKLEAQGAEGVILGCTEIPMLISDKDVNIPTFNTTEIHAAMAVDWATAE
ncbi:aspartate/glutamate racemase family protein [Flammeovirgaceae bacterium SG7u.111]|nr:aspartate/glutamate racemase family protein [Flammeovirgaceae bacterium SG7u.132]WPO36590.1 aspartate/glutamate racemase family protein [Flammeovirgaceae bacterium SG7u.111]